MGNMITQIREHERGLLFREGDFVKLLPAGRHRLWRNLLPFGGRSEIEVYDALEAKFEHRLLRTLVDKPSLVSQLEVIDLADDERAVVRIDGRVSAVLGPGLHAFWNAPHSIEIERHEAGDEPFDHPQLAAVLRASGTAAMLQTFNVDTGRVAVVYRDGEQIAIVGPGRHVYWKGPGTLGVRMVDLRESTLDIGGQEIMTQDKVALRLNLLVRYRVTDPELAVNVSDDYTQSLYREAQLALRASVGTRTLDALLTDKESVGAELRSLLVERATAIGLEVQSVGLRDIILPGDMREMINQVILAEKQAQANIIRRREETAAARSQANTAKLLSDNPVLARLKELEMLQEILAGTKATFVIGRGDLTEQLRGALRTELTPTDD